MSDQSFITLPMASWSVMDMDVLAVPLSDEEQAGLWEALDADPWFAVAAARPAPAAPAAPAASDATAMAEASDDDATELSIDIAELPVPGTMAAHAAVLTAPSATAAVASLIGVPAILLDHVMQQYFPQQQQHGFALASHMLGPLGALHGLVFPSATRLQWRAHTLVDATAYAHAAQVILAALASRNTVLAALHALAAETNARLEQAVKIAHTALVGVRTRRQQLRLV